MKMTTTECPRVGLKANVSSLLIDSPENLGKFKTFPGLYSRWGPLAAGASAGAFSGAGFSEAMAH
jgi:hypothetical protein